MSCNFKKSFLPCLDSILGIREQIGAEKADVYLVTRVWSGRVPGDGFHTDTEEMIRPKPMIVDLSHDIRLQEAGVVKQGDLFIRQISKARYPHEKDIDCQTTAKNIEKFYKVGEHYYTLIQVVERHLTWDIQVRKHVSRRDY